MLQYYFLLFHFKSNICGGRRVNYIYIDQITCHIIAINWTYIYKIKAKSLKENLDFGVQGYLPVFSLSVHQVVFTSGIIFLSESTLFLGHF
jgi:hypothetical protein